MVTPWCLKAPLKLAKFLKFQSVMIHVENAVVIIMIIDRYNYVFAKATHKSHSGRLRMGRKVYQTEAERREATSFLVEWDEGWMDTWEPQEVFRNVQVAINEYLPSGLGVTKRTSSIAQAKMISRLNGSSKHH